MVRQEKQAQLVSPEALYAAYPGVHAHRDLESRIQAIIHRQDQPRRTYALSTTYADVVGLLVKSQMGDSDPHTVVFRVHADPVVSQIELGHDWLTVIAADIHQIVRMVHAYNGLSDDNRRACSPDVVSDATRPRFRKDILYRPALQKLGLHFESLPDSHLSFIEAVTAPFRLK